jgi:hypothetical protein
MKTTTAASILFIFGIQQLWNKTNISRNFEEVRTPATSSSPSLRTKAKPANKK